MTERGPMKITAIIPAYNAERTITRAVSSVLNQTRPADEVIVVDDGSSDGTVDVIRSFGDKVILIQQQNAGASAARNAGINAATGNWIAFLDADDEWLPCRLELQVAHLQRHWDLVWVTGNYTRCFCDPDHFQYKSDAGAGQQLLDENGTVDYFKAYLANVSGNMDTKLIKKSILYEAGLFRIGQLRINDDDLWFRIAYRHPRIGYVTEPLAVYHMGVENSIMKKYRDTAIICDFLNRHLELSKSHGRYDDFHPVAKKMAKCWVCWSWADKRIFQIRMILRDFGFLFPLWYKTVLFVLTVCPGFTLRCMPVLRKINRILKIPL